MSIVGSNGVLLRTGILVRGDGQKEDFSRI